MADTSLFFDSYAIIEVLKGSAAYTRFHTSVIQTTVLNLAEVYYALLRTYGQKQADRVAARLQPVFLPISAEAALQAARFRFQNRKLALSYADCIGYLIAEKNNLVFLTGDKAFASMKNVEFVP